MPRGLQLACLALALAPACVPYGGEVDVHDFRVPVVLGAFDPGELGDAAALADAAPAFAITRTIDGGTQLLSGPPGSTGWRVRTVTLARLVLRSARASDAVGDDDAGNVMYDTSGLEDDTAVEACAPGQASLAFVDSVDVLAGIHQGISPPVTIAHFDNAGGGRCGFEFDVAPQPVAEIDGPDDHAPSVFGLRAVPADVELQLTAHVRVPPGPIAIVGFASLDFTISN